MLWSLYRGCHAADLHVHQHQEKGTKYPLSTLISIPVYLELVLTLHDLTKENIIQIKNVRDSQGTSTDKNFKDFLNVQ